MTIGLKNISAAVAVSLLGSTAMANGFTGGDVNYRYANSDDYGYYANVVTGSAAFGFGGVIGQVDVQVQGYDGTWDAANSFGIHLGYAVSSDMTVGAFYVVEDWSGTDYPVYGIEGTYSNAMLDADVAIGSYRNSDPADDYFKFVALDVDYHVNSSFDVLGRMTLLSDGSTGGNYDGTILGVGGRYNHQSGAYLEASLYSVNWTGGSSINQVELKVGYEFGGGAEFQSRGWNDILINY